MPCVGGEGVAKGCAGSGSAHPHFETVRATGENIERRLVPHPGHLRVRHLDSSARTAAACFWVIRICRCWRSVVCAGGCGDGANFFSPSRAFSCHFPTKSSAAGVFRKNKVPVLKLTVVSHSPPPSLRPQAQRDVGFFLHTLE